MYEDKPSPSQPNNTKMILSLIIRRLMDKTNIKRRLVKRLCWFISIYEYLNLMIIAVINNTDAKNIIDNQSKRSLIWSWENIIDNKGNSIDMNVL